MKNAFKERLVQFAREKYNMGFTNFEKFTGITSGTISKIRDGISTTNLAKIMQKCPELNVRWLLLGEGQMVAENSVKGSSVPTFDIHNNDTVNINERLTGIEKELQELKEERKKLLSIIENLTK